MVRPELRTPAAVRQSVDVVVVTTQKNHLLDEVGRVSLLFHHEQTDVAPLDLPFAAHRVLAREMGRYDAFGYLEDDIVVHDPFVFEKQHWFGSVVGHDALLMPSRYETSGGAKAYPDADLPAVALEELTLPPGPQSVTARWMEVDLSFYRPSNPHAACFFVDASQMQQLAHHRFFGVPNSAFVGPIETASTAAVTETFRVYKAASPHTDFLEVEHQGSHYLSVWGVPPELHVLEAARRAAEVRAEIAAEDASTARAAGASALQEIDDLKRSNSWRVTQPLRRLSDLLARLRGVDKKRPTGR